MPIHLCLIWVYPKVAQLSWNRERYKMHGHFQDPKTKKKWRDYLMASCECCYSKGIIYIPNQGDGISAIAGGFHYCPFAVTHKVTSMNSPRPIEETYSAKTGNLMKWTSLTSLKTPAFLTWLNFTFGGQFCFIQVIFWTSPLLTSWPTSGSWLPIFGKGALSFDWSSWDHTFVKVFG